MAISNVLLNAALDAYFWRGGLPTAMKLYNTSDGLIDTETVYFSEASGGSTEVTSVVFAVSAGTTVDYVTLDISGTVFETVEVANETFSTNGTYTINLFRKTLEG